MLGGGEGFKTPNLSLDTTLIMGNNTTSGLHIKVD